MHATIETSTGRLAREAGFRLTILQKMMRTFWGIYNVGRTYFADVDEAAHQFFVAE